MPDLNFDPVQFLKTDWQRRPRLLKNYAPIAQHVTPDELAGLAIEDCVESRLVQFDGEQQWHQIEGPFQEEQFSSLPEHNWTLLVQAVDLWLPAIAELYELFSFLPRWRFDDIMVSYATPGGGVGPHFDFYDVFLVQVDGQRRWRIGQVCDEQSEIRTDTGMKTLAHFEHHETFETEPGDVLYIPPRFAHWGEAIDESVTYSVGLRAPTAQEMLYDLSFELEARGDCRYLQDVDRSYGSDPLEIQAGDIRAAQQLLREVIDNDALIGGWLARYMSRPKYEDSLATTGERRIARYNDKTYENGELAD